MIFYWLTPTYPTIALPWTPISRLYNAEKFSLFNGGSHFLKAKKVTSDSKKLIFFNAFHFIIPKGRQLRGSRRIDLSIKYSWLALVYTVHNCFNPLSLFELCFPIDWRLLVDWDISNIGLLENSFFFDWFSQFWCFGCFWGCFWSLQTSLLWT